MKALKTLPLFGICLVLASCFDAPEFSNSPHIEYKSIYFGISKDPDKPLDSLVLELDFEDGDGDLGLGPEFRNEPFHANDYFLGNGSDITATVREIYYTDVVEPILDIPNDATGKLVRRNDLPNLPAGECNYRLGTIYLAPSDLIFIDDTYMPTELQNPTRYAVSGDFFVDPNENNKNITVRFFYTDSPQPGPNDFTEHIWPGCSSFDGRFDRLSDDDSALSGTMRYTMHSSGFQAAMSTKYWQLRITIKDRLLNVSNEVTTELFTLKGITRN